MKHFFNEVRGIISLILLFTALAIAAVAFIPVSILLMIGNSVSPKMKVKSAELKLATEKLITNLENIKATKG